MFFGGKMQNKFFEYHMNDENVLSDLIENALIVLDTNALLNLYRYNDENRRKYFEVLESIKNRLILPYQVGYEFYENRENIIRYKSLFKEKMKSCLNDEIGLLEQKIKSNAWDGKDKDFHKYLQYEEKLKEELISILNEAKNAIDSKLDNCKNDLEISWIKGNDRILANILVIFENNVCDQLCNLEEIYKEADKGYEEKNVPGYKDVKKETTNRYGDYIVWKEMIEIAKKYKKDVLFISNDRKEDWVHKLNGIDLGTNRHLIKKFKEETSHLIFSLKVDDFIKRISDLNEIKEIEQLMQQTKEIEIYKVNDILKQSRNEIYHEHQKANLDDLIDYINIILYKLDRLNIGIYNWNKFTYKMKIKKLYEHDLISYEELLLLQDLEHIRHDILNGEKVDYQISLVANNIFPIMNRLNEMSSKYFMVCPRCHFTGYVENSAQCPQCGYNNDDY